MKYRSGLCIALVLLHISFSKSQDYEFPDSQIDIWEINDQELLNDAISSLKTICDSFHLSIGSRVIPCSDIVVTPILETNRIYTINKREIEDKQEGSGSGLALIEEQVVNSTDSPVEVPPIIEVLRAPLSDNIANDTVVQEPEEQIPEGETLEGPTPVEQTPVEQTPVEQRPVEQTPVEQTPLEQTPVEQTPLEQTSEEVVPPSNLTDTNSEVPSTETKVEQDTVEVKPEITNFDEGAQPKQDDNTKDAVEHVDKAPGSVDSTVTKPNPVDAEEKNPAESNVDTPKESDSAVQEQPEEEKKEPVPVTGTLVKPPLPPPPFAPVHTHPEEHDKIPDVVSESEQPHLPPSPPALPSDLAEERETIKEHQSNNAALLESPDNDASGVEGSDSEKVLRTMANNANQELQKETPATGQSAKDVQRGSKSTTVLLILLVVVLVAGAAILIRKYTGSKKSSNEVETTKNGDVERGSEMKPLMKEGAKAETKEYADTSPKEIPSK